MKRPRLITELTPVDVVHDLILLTDYNVPMDEIRKWTWEEREAVADWAAATHLRASDNHNKVPPKPEILSKYPKDKLLLDW